MKTYFDEDGRPIAVDETHPVDILEPEEEAPIRSTPDAILMIDRIGGSFLRGNPFIIQVAWSFLLNQQSRSMEFWAKKLGCSRQAISKQVARLANRFGYPISNRLSVEMRRRAAKKSRAARKRR
ncbi:MAG: HTH domain-containing protein [Verrucomicrobia bacterium]|nr:HTH domain-containing protein [Verrucomicrobiota bacterium]